MQMKTSKQTEDKSSQGLSDKLKNNLFKQVAKHN